MSREQFKNGMEQIYKLLIFVLASTCVYFLKMQVDTLTDLKEQMIEMKQWEAVDKIQHSDMIENGKMLSDMVHEHQTIIQKNLTLGKIVR